MGKKSKKSKRKLNELFNDTDTTNNTASNPRKKIKIQSQSKANIPYKWREGKIWEEWEKQYVVNAYNGLQGVADDIKWKRMAAELEGEIIKRRWGMFGRSWKSIKYWYLSNIGFKGSFIATFIRFRPAMSDKKIKTFRKERRKIIKIYGKDAYDKMESICDELRIAKGLVITVKLYGFESHLKVYEEIWRLSQISNDDQREKRIAQYKPRSGKLRDIQCKIDSEGKIGKNEEMMRGISKKMKEIRSDAPIKMTFAKKDGTIHFANICLKDDPTKMIATDIWMRATPKLQNLDTLEMKRSKVEFRGRIRLNEDKKWKCYKLSKVRKL